MRIYHTVEGGLHCFRNGLLYERKIDAAYLAHYNEAEALFREQRPAAADAEIIHMEKPMTRGTYYLTERGKMLHRSGSLDYLLRFTGETTDAEIWYNNVIVWAQQPDNI